MRESPVFEVRLHRFAVWRAAVAAVAGAAIAAALAWAFATAASAGGDGIAAVVAVAAVLTAATLAVAASIGRVPRGLLSCRDGQWSFVADAGASWSGRLTVALDFGSFLLLQLQTRPWRSLWLPVQRRGLESDWHALRCAVYSPPRPAAGLASAPPSTPE